MPMPFSVYLQVGRPLRGRRKGWWARLLLSLSLAVGAQAAASPDYAIVVSAPTLADPGWSNVVAALQLGRQATVLEYATGALESVLPGLQRVFPRRTAFVARPEEATREFVTAVHQLMRRLDEDPYTDGFWGIVTGYDAANALRLARHRAPLTVRRVAAGTEVALECCPEGVWYSELKAGHAVRKQAGETPASIAVPTDTTALLAQALTDYGADLFVTSGHATERDWQIGFGYRNGRFLSRQGKLYGEDLQRQQSPIASPGPRVYLPVGNCLMGHIDGPDAMALAFLNSAGVYQMIGYTLPTWYGYAGWGCLDYFVEQPGRYNFVEAFTANQHALAHRLETFFPGLADAAMDAQGRLREKVALTDRARQAGLRETDGRGLRFDRDTVAFYGDPAWVARMADGPLGWEQALSETDGLWTFTVQPTRGEGSFRPVNLNGSQRGGRPFIQFLPHRIQNVRVIAGAEWEPVVTDDFILVPRPSDPARPVRVLFRAQRIGGGSP